MGEENNRSSKSIFFLLQCRFSPLVKVAQCDAHSKDDYNGDHDDTDDVAWRREAQQNISELYITEVFGLPNTRTHTRTPQTSSNSLTSKIFLELQLQHTQRAKVFLLFGPRANPLADSHHRLRGSNFPLRGSRLGGLNALCGERTSCRVEGFCSCRHGQSLVWRQSECEQ